MSAVTFQQLPATRRSRTHGAGERKPQLNAPSTTHVTNQQMERSADRSTVYAVFYSLCFSFFAFCFGAPTCLPFLLAPQIQLHVLFATPSAAMDTPANKRGASAYHVTEAGQSRVAVFKFGSSLSWARATKICSELACGRRFCLCIALPRGKTIVGTNVSVCQRLGHTVCVETRNK